VSDFGRRAGGWMRGFFEADFAASITWRNAILKQDVPNRGRGWGQIFETKYPG